jgi:hypothetical protein
MTILEFVVSHTDNSRGIIYDHDVFTVSTQAKGHLPSLSYIR